jgi:5'-3' exoribonuclease 4
MLILLSLLFISSGGMNGYLWACERNVLSSIVPSPIDGLPDIESNQVL